MYWKPFSPKSLRGWVGAERYDEKICLYYM